MRKNPALVLTIISLILWMPSISHGSEYYFKTKTTSAAMMGQPAQESITEVWVTKDKIKSIDNANQQSFIVRLDTDKVYIVNQKNKSYTEIPMAQFRKFAQMGMGMMQSQKEIPAKTDVNRTGKKQKIGQWNCEQVVVTHEGSMSMSMDIWVTQDVNISMDDYKQYAETFGMTSMMGDFFKKIQELPGFPIKQTMTMNLYGTNLETVSEVTEIIVKTIDKSIFELPQGYTKNELKMPGMPAESTTK